MSNFYDDYNNKIDECYLEFITLKIYDTEYMKNLSYRDLKHHKQIIELSKRQKNLRFPIDYLSKFGFIQLNEYLSYINEKFAIKIEKDYAENKSREQRHKYIDEVKKRIFINIVEFDNHYETILSGTIKQKKTDRNDYINDKIKFAKHYVCQCGSSVNIYKKKQHETTKKHKNCILSIG